MTRSILLAILTVCSASAAYRSWADEPQEEPKEQMAIREYLPVLQHRMNLVIEKINVNSLDYFSKLSRVFQEGGIISPLEVGELEQELLRARIRYRKQQTAFEDALDRFKLKFDLPLKRLQEIEKETTGPLEQHLTRLAGLSVDLGQFRNDLSRNLEPEKASRIRAFLHAATTTSALFKDSPFGQRFSSKWNKWEKQRSLSDKDIRAERRRLLDLKADYEVKNQTLPAKDRQRLQEMDFQLDLVTLERGLREFENQPWKVLKDERSRKSALEARIRKIKMAINPLIGYAGQEWLARWRESWPELPPVRIEKTDMLKCDWEQAQKTLQNVLPKKKEKVDCQIMVRQLRSLAEIYTNEQGLLEISHSLVDQTLDSFNSPSGDLLETPSGPPPLTPLSLARLLRANRSLNRIQKQLWQTWFHYQATRLDLYKALKLPVP